MIAWFLVWLRHVLLLVFLGILTGIVLDAMANAAIQFLRAPRGVAVVASAIILLALVAGSVALLILPLMREETGFIHELPDRTARFSDKFEQYRNDIPWLKQILPSPKEDESLSNELIYKKGTAHRYE